MVFDIQTITFCIRPGWRSTAVTKDSAEHPHSHYISINQRRCLVQDRMKLRTTILTGQKNQDTIMSLEKRDAQIKTEKPLEKKDDKRKHEIVELVNAAWSDRSCRAMSDSGMCTSAERPHSLNRVAMCCVIRAEARRARKSQRPQSIVRSGPGRRTGRKSGCHPQSPPQ